MSPIDPEVKNKLEEIDCDLREHDLRLRDLERGFERNTIILQTVTEGQNKLEDRMIRLENTTLSNHNVLLGSLNQLMINRENNDTNIKINEINNDTNKQISKHDNLTRILLQLLILITAISAGIYTGVNII